MRSLRPIALTIFAVAVAVACAQPLAPQHPQSAPRVQPAGELLDLNTATPQQLNELPGFGPAYTRRVIAGRPYTSKNQLVTSGVLPAEAYQRVSALIIAHRPAR
jgi:competence protein ComEA